VNSHPIFPFLVCLGIVAMSSLMATPGCVSTQSVSPVAESLDSLGFSLRGIREANIRLAYRDGLTIERRPRESSTAAWLPLKTSLNGCS